MTSVISKAGATLALVLLIVTSAAVTANADGSYTKVRSDDGTSYMSRSPIPRDAYDIAVYDLDGECHILSDHLDAGEYVVLEWFNPDCAYSRKYFTSTNRVSTRDEALALARDNGIVWLMVNSSAPGSTGSGQDRNMRAIEEYAIDVPLILDETGEFGRAFNVTTTPHVVLLSPEREVLYTGMFDDTVLITDDPSENYVLTAIRQVTDDPWQPVLSTQPGCAVTYARVTEN